MKMKLFRYLFLPLILLYTIRVIGQEQNLDGCLNHEQLYQLYSGNIQSMGQMMGKQRFFMVSNEKNVSIAWMDDTLTIDLYNWQFSMGFNDIYVNVFHKEGFYNFVEYNTTANCANKLLQECKAIHMEQYDDLHDSTDTQQDMDSLLNPILNKYQQISTQLTFDFENGYSFIFPEEKTGNGQFLIRVYNPTDFDKLILINKTQQEQELIARRIKEQTILSHIAAADSLAQIEEFPTAIHLLEEVYDLLPDYITTVDAKLGTIKKQYKDKKIQTYTEEGDRLYELGDYNGALTMYDNVLKEDMNNRYALEHIDLINRKLDILHQRGQVTFDYTETNPKNYMEFRDALADELNKLIDNTANGSLRMDYSILFDTMAINHSFYNILEFNTISLEKNQSVLQSRMSNLLGHKSLQPSYREEIPIRSATTFKLDIAWDSFSQVVIKKRKKIVNTSHIPLNPLIEDALRDDSKMYYGKYFFDSKSKSCNNKESYDISLTKYRTVGGEAFFYGLFPGLGTLIATQGKEGAACMVLSLLSYGGAAASYVLFNNYKKEYNEKASALSESDANKLKTKREVCKWSAIAGVSIGGTIHLSGMIKAMVRGIQNKKASKELRQALQHEPIEINKENIQIQ